MPDGHTHGPHEGGATTPGTDPLATFPPSPDEPTGLPGQLVPLHPMTVADILDGSFRTWRSVIGPVTLLVLLIMGPYELLSNLYLAFQAPGLAPQDGFLAPLEFDLVAVALVFLVALFGVVVWSIAATAVISFVVQVDRGGDRRVGRALRAAVGRSGVVLVCMLLLGLAGIALFVGAIILALIPLLGIVLLLLTGPIVMGAFVAMGAMFVPIAVVERRGPIATIARAAWVLRVRFWRTIGVTWLMLIVLVGVSLGLSTVVELLAFTAGPAYWAILAVSSLMVAAVQVPVMSLAALLVYLDARILQEAFDLEVRVARLAAG